MIILDHFLESYQELKAYSLTCQFEDLTNPADEVVYPNICKDLPEKVEAELIDKLSKIKGGEIENPTVFLRQSPQGVPVPHIAHTDNVMGKYSFMLYLNRKEGCGTAFLRHIKTGIAFLPKEDGLIKRMVRDQNDLTAWQVCDSVLAQENRAVIFDSERFHRAEPVGGFGETQADSRIVLTCFFS